jgi:hypothetical protein
MTPAEFDACFDRFGTTAFRLETLPAYAVGGAEAERLEAFREGRPRPERSVRTSPWLRRIATSTADGKYWQRVRVLDEPLTEYQRYQLASLVESAACGEDIRVAVAGVHVHPGDVGGDFWLLDAETPAAAAILLTYDGAGRFAAAELHRDTETVLACMADADFALRCSVPLNEYLATSQNARSAA